MNAPVILDVDLRDEALLLPTDQDSISALLWWGDRVLGEAILTSGDEPWARLRTRLISRWRPVIDAIAVLPTYDAPAEITPEDVSVVVRTRGLPGQLSDCLDALGRLDPAPSEVIVVDSHPPSRAVAEATEGRDVRVVQPAALGSSHARNAGWRAATTPVVAFTDDDARPHPRWVRALADGFTDAKVVCVTGLVLPAELLTPAQRIFEASASTRRDFSPRLFASPAPGADTNRLGAGVNAAFRRDYLERIGGFDTSLGTGRTKGAEDLDAFLRVMSLGGVLAYRPDAVVRQVYPRDVPSLLRHHAGTGRSYAALLHQHGLGGEAAAAEARKERVRWHRDRHVRAILGAVRRRKWQRMVEPLCEIVGSRPGRAVIEAGPAAVTS